MPSLAALPRTHNAPVVASNFFQRIQEHTRLLHDFAELFKLRVTAMIGATAWCGAYLAARGNNPVLPASAILGPVLAITALAAGSAALNEFLERDTDAKMLRTANRPLVDGRISAGHAVTLSLALSLCAISYLALRANLLTAALAVLTAVTYLGVYTPLKKITPQCTTIGAIPGAMPGVLGWTAVRGSLGLESLALFAVVFCWQFPHFYAIAILHRDDYQRAGLRLFPFAGDDGVLTMSLIQKFSVILVLASAVLGSFVRHPVACISIALLLGIGFIVSTSSCTRKPSQSEYECLRRRARRVLRATVIYLPALFALLVVTHSC